MCFAAYLICNEFSLEKRPKNYVHLLFELGLPLHIACFHLLELGTGVGSWPEAPLDFRANFLQTWLAVTTMGSLAVSLGPTMPESLIQVGKNNSKFT